MSAAYIPRHARTPGRSLCLAALVASLAALAMAALSLMQGPPAAPSTPQPSPAATASARSGPVPPPAQPRSKIAPKYAVHPGDCLWTIAARYYGTGTRWHLIYAANRAVIGPDPSLLQQGAHLVIPLT